MDKNYSGFTFHMTTEIVFGKGAVAKVGQYVKKYGGTKALVVMDGGGFIKSSGLFDKVAASLSEAGIGYVEHEGVKPNPLASFMLEGLEKAHKEGIDFVLGIGGGSTMDTSKAIALALANEGDVMDFFRHKRRPERIGGFGAISTIASSGSETSGSALLLDDLEGGSGIKGGFNNPDLRARFAISDPELTYTVPPFQTGCGAADMFAHTYDSYLTDDFSFLGDAFAEGVMRTAVVYGPMAIENPTNYEARAELLLNASFAHNDVSRIGRAGNAPTTHFLEEALSNVFHSTHGAGIALVMPAITQIILDKGKDPAAPERLAKLATNVFGVDPSLGSTREVAQRGIDLMSEWLTKLGMPTTIREYARIDEVSEAQIDEVMSYVKYGDDGVFFGYGNVCADDIREMFRSIA